MRITAISIGILFAAVAAVALYQPESQAQRNSSGEEQETVHVVSVPSTGYKAAPKSKLSEQGEKLFKDFNCMSCHSVHNVGGDLAPSLDGVGGRRTAQFLLAHLSNSPEAQEEYKRIRGVEYSSAAARHSRYSPETAKLLVAYLNTLPEPAGNVVVLPHTLRLPVEPTEIVNKDFKPSAKSEVSGKGEKLYEKYRCVACHAVGEVGGWFGPRLDGVGARRSRTYITAHVTDAQAHAKTAPDEHEAKMPSMSIPDSDAKAITEYLLTLPGL